MHDKQAALLPYTGNRRKSAQGRRRNRRADTLFLLELAKVEKKYTLAKHVGRNWVSRPLVNLHIHPDRLRGSAADHTGAVLRRPPPQKAQQTCVDETDLQGQLPAMIKLKEIQQYVNVLYQRGSIGDDVYESFKLQSKLQELELNELAMEAESFKKGWAQTFFPVCQEVTINEALRRRLNSLEPMKESLDHQWLKQVAA
ncbi:hypothetical protein KL939_003895 [Ogataea angusta]|nr:hypothetical protein KL941_003168 [Ogataea angusta]KAG7856243.1 hypothetical protein KL939_003895 [Ogataea angusta]